MPLRKKQSAAGSLRQEILDKVKVLHRLQERERRFIPGTTYIPYGGRVYDEEELVRLVDASLDRNSILSWAISCRENMSIKW